MGCIRGSVVLLAVVGVACTVSNPAFDVDATVGDDDDDDDGEAGDTGAATSASAESDAGSLEGSNGDESPAETSMGEGEADADDATSEGTVECEGMVDYDWEVALLDDGVPLPNLDCTVPLMLEGRVLASADDTVVFSPCNGCDCAPTDGLEVHAPGLLRGADFPVDSCVRIEIDWSPAEPCRPIGFVASSDAALSLRPVSMAGQDVATMPQSLGGGPILMPTTEPCRCPDCCEKSGIASLDFGSGGGPIREGEEGHVDGLAGSERTWLVTVHEAHVHDDCTRALAWSAFVDET